MAYTPTKLDRDIYDRISGSRGLKAREIAEQLGAGKKEVNQALYHSPLMQELCWQDRSWLWHSLIPQTVPHEGLRDFSGYYSDVRTFLAMPEEQWLEQLKQGCERIGRNLNDTRGLIHSFLDCRQTIRSLFQDLTGFGGEQCLDWELVFEFRLKQTRHIRIYADVLVVTQQYVFSLEFKMKDQIDPEEVAQAAKYVPYLELIFGRRYEVVPVLVLTRAADLYEMAEIPGREGAVPVCSGDMLFNSFNEYLHFLRD